MKKEMAMVAELMMVAVVAAAGTAMAAEPAAKATVTVDLKAELGPVRIMNAVNGGPTVKKPRGDQKKGNFEDYKALRIPFARTHDCINCVPGGAHTCDIDAIFPNFDADENDPRNYDFVFTDHYLDNMKRAGTDVFFRLGQTIEHGPKKYGVLPPKDFAKWARICEHIIRHYNEGWGWGLDTARTTKNIAWSNQFNIVYWEIWNEPDLDPCSDIRGNTSPRCWGGTTTDFFEFYEIAARHLKGKFPTLKIGGPALCGREDWGEKFLAYCHDHKVPMDFFSWHVYARTPEAIAAKAGRIRAMMDKYGYADCESLLNEWNYVKGWTDDFVYSLRVECGDLNFKGAAFVAATMVACQSAPVDMLMYYDARPRGMNGMFEPITLWPMKGYYPFYAWAKLLDRGTQVACRVREGTGEDSDANTGNVERKDVASAGQFFATAAKGKDGSGAVFVVRYSDDDNSSETGELTLRIPGADLSKARCHLTDLVRTYTEVPLEVEPDGSATIRMQPLSFALIEF